MKINSPDAGLRISPTLVCEFFATFSRFEYALKECDFVMFRRGFIEPDWHGFGEHAADFAVEQGSELDAAISYLTESAPKVQTAKMDWQSKDLHGRTPMAQAIAASCRVRNNLFHGGKHTRHSPDGHDQRLVECALAVLNACLEQNDRLREIFEQPA